MLDVFQRKERFWSFSFSYKVPEKNAVAVAHRLNTSEKKSHTVAKQANLTLGCIDKS